MWFLNFIKTFFLKQHKISDLNAYNFEELFVDNSDVFEKTPFNTLVSNSN